MAALILSSAVPPLHSVVRAAAEVRFGALAGGCAGCKIGPHLAIPWVAQRHRGA